jgi:hypothetical protein
MAATGRADVPAAEADMTTDESQIDKRPITEEELEEARQACSELPHGRYLYGYVDLKSILYGGEFKSGCVGELVVAKARSRKADAGWKHYCDDGGEVWTDCWIRVLSGELVLAFKMHDHVKEFAIELWEHALDRLPRFLQ